MFRGLDRVAAQRANAHGRDVEHLCAVGLRAVLAADTQPVSLQMLVAAVDRVVDPLVARRVGIEFGPEGLDALDILRPPVDQGALIVGVGPALMVAVQQILAHIRREPLAEPAEMGAARTETYPDRKGAW